MIRSLQLAVGLLIGAVLLLAAAAIVWGGGHLLVKGADEVLHPKPGIGKECAPPAPAAEGSC